MNLEIWAKDSNLGSSYPQDLRVSTLSDHLLISPGCALNVACRGPYMKARIDIPDHRSGSECSLHLNYPIILYGS